MRVEQILPGFDSLWSTTTKRPFHLDNSHEIPVGRGQGFVMILLPPRCGSGLNIEVVSQDASGVQRDAEAGTGLNY